MKPILILAALALAGCATVGDGIVTPEECLALTAAAEQAQLEYELDGSTSSALRRIATGTAIAAAIKCGQVAPTV